MKVFPTPRRFSSWRQKISIHDSVGFVPTMGALHEGHLSLIHRSKKENKHTVVSIFVNPTQFGPHEDFNRYPRPWKKDQYLLKSLQVDVVFAPSAGVMYSDQSSTSIEVRSLNNVLCGSPQFRGPSHFNGVATVVAKLFNVVRPTKAYFGLKDYQQVRVIEQMVEDLNFDLKIVRCPTVREKDGLAMSSRNAYLSETERRQSARLYAALQQGAKLLTSEHVFDEKIIQKKVTSVLTSIPSVKIDYVELVDGSTLQKVGPSTRSLLLAAAIHIGKTRLIDNILVKRHA